MVVQDVLKQLAEDIRQFTRSETIFGEAIEIQGNTIIPICRVSVGYGGGGGEGENTAERKPGSKGTGGGGGAGIRIEPSGLIVARDGKISIVPISGRESKVGSLLDKLPEVFGKIKTGNPKKSEADKADD
jgi:uncharacterized spore protein YtfJ